MEYIGRFAPSPSGRMHLGNVFCALLAWLDARKSNGEIILRVEDLDPERCKAEYAQVLMEDMRWLGLDWDRGGEASTYQSARRDLYEQAIERLRAHAQVYPCYCTRAQLHDASAPHASDGRVMYTGRCKALAKGAPRKAGEREGALRLAVPPKEITFIDGVYGRYTEDLCRECGDFVIRRSDGVHAYQLAVVVDDAAMGVTHVVRGRDLLSSTPRQLLLYELLGERAPQFIHVPLLCAPDGRRLSKRDGDLDMGALRSAGVTAQEIIGFLMWKAGMTARFEPLDLEEALCMYARDKIPGRDICITPDDTKRFLHAGRVF